MKVTIIVPIFNEEERAEAFIENLISFCENSLNDYEILLVNDASTDNTIELLKEFEDKKIKIISLSENIGKGASIQLGVKKALGEKIIFIDCDGAVHPKQIPYLLKKLRYFDVVIGDRELSESFVLNNWFRIFIGRGFNWLVRLLFDLPFKDTQCGFKGFSREVAKKTFNGLFSKRWVFDVEVLYKAKRLGYSICCIPVVWKNVEGSKINFVVALKMGYDLLNLKIKLWWCHLKIRREKLFKKYAYEIVVISIATLLYILGWYLGVV